MFELNVVVDCLFAGILFVTLRIRTAYSVLNLFSSPSFSLFDKQSYQLSPVCSHYLHPFIVYFYRLQALRKSLQIILIILDACQAQLILGKGLPILLIIVSAFFVAFTVLFESIIIKASESLMLVLQTNNGLSNIFLLEGDCIV